MGGVTLLFLLIVASSASGLVIKPESEPDLNPVVKEQLNHLKNAVVKNSCYSSCPYGWVNFDGRCFHYFGQAMDWATAEGYCLNLGANLVSVHSENEYQLVKSLIRAYDLNENPTWIGLSNCQKRNNWVWSDGTKYRYSKWNSHEPNHYNNECCVHINWSTEKNWNDITCEEKNPFVCVRRLA